MEKLHDLAIVLRWVPFEDRHKIVTLLTEKYGKISALARNSIHSKRYGGALEPFAASDLIFVERHGADLYRIEQATIRKCFDHLFNDFERFSLASLLNEIMLRIAPERQVCSDLFRLHSNALSILNEMKEPGSELFLLNLYLAKILQWSGSQPRLQNCQGCGLSLDVLPAQCTIHCLISDAGWVCDDCRSLKTHHVQNLKLLKITGLALKDLHQGISLPLRQAVTVLRASPQEHRALYLFLEALFIYHLPGFGEKPLKSLRFLGLESNVQPHLSGLR